MSESESESVASSDTPEKKTKKPVIKRKWSNEELLQLSGWLVYRIENHKGHVSLISNKKGCVDKDFLMEYINDHEVDRTVVSIQLRLKRMKEEYNATVEWTKSTGAGLLSGADLKAHIEQKCIFFEHGKKIWTDIKTRNMEVPYFSGSTSIGPSETTTEEQLNGHRLDGAPRVVRSQSQEGFEEPEDIDDSAGIPSPPALFSDDLSDGSLAEHQQLAAPPAPVASTSRGGTKRTRKGKKNTNTSNNKNPNNNQNNSNSNNNVETACTSHIQAAERLTNRTVRDELLEFEESQRISDATLSKYQTEYLNLEREKIDIEKEKLEIERAKLQELARMNEWTKIDKKRKRKDKMEVAEKEMEAAKLRCQAEKLALKTNLIRLELRQIENPESTVSPRLLDMIYNSENQDN